MIEPIWKYSKSICNTKLDSWSGEYTRTREEKENKDEKEREKEKISAKLIHHSFMLSYFILL